MRRHRKNPAFVAWMSAHPWMTFFVAMGLIAIPVQLAEIAAIKKQLPPPSPTPQPQTPLNAPTPAAVPVPVPAALGGGTALVVKT